MDEKWIEKELGKLANSLHFPPADLDQKTRMRIRKEMPLRKGRSVSRTKLKTMGILPASAPDAGPARQPCGSRPLGCACCGPFRSAV